MTQGRRQGTLIDGNKRLGWLATAVFLEINGIDTTTISSHDIYEFVMHLADHDRPVGEIGDALQELARGSTR